MHGSTLHKLGPLTSCAQRSAKTRREDPSDDVVMLITPIPPSDGSEVEGYEAYLGLLSNVLFNQRNQASPISN